jgi:hypothetical protein
VGYSEGIQGLWIQLDYLFCMGYGLNTETLYFFVDAREDIICGNKF